MTTVVQTGFSALSGTSTLAVTTSAASVSVPGLSDYETVRITNTGAVTAYVLFTKASTAATTSNGTPVYPGTTVYFQSTGISISAITASGATSLDITGGNGVGQDSSASDGTAAAAVIVSALGPATQHQAVTPSDSTTYTGTKALFVGNAGNLVATDVNGVDATYVCTDGQYVLLTATKVKAATTATNIVRLY